MGRWALVVLLGLWPIWDGTNLAHARKGGGTNPPHARRWGGRIYARLRAGAARPANPYDNPYVDVRYWYPKYYGGFHYRTLHRSGYSSPNYPLRGLPW